MTPWIDPLAKLIINTWHEILIKIDLPGFSLRFRLILFQDGQGTQRIKQENMGMNFDFRIGIAKYFQKT